MNNLFLDVNMQYLQKGQILYSVETNALVSIEETEANIIILSNGVVYDYSANGVNVFSSHFGLYLVPLVSTEQVDEEPVEIAKPIFQARASQSFKGTVITKDFSKLSTRAL